MKSALLTLCKTGEILIVLWIVIFVRHVRAFTAMRENSIITQSNDTSAYRLSLPNDNSRKFYCDAILYQGLPWEYKLRSPQPPTESIIWTSCKTSIELECFYVEENSKELSMYHLPKETVLDGSKRLDDFEITKNLGPFRKIIYLPLISTNDIGWYTVVYNDSNTFNTRSFYINVTCGDTTDKSQAETVQKIQNGASPPYFLGNKNDTLNIDIKMKKILMICFGRGYPIPRCQWFENNIPISSDEHVMSQWFCGIRKSPKLGHSANYTCSLENSNGSINKTFVVDVKDQPPVLINSSQRNITLRLGQSINLTCEFSTTSQPWLTYWDSKTWSLERNLIKKWSLDRNILPLSSWWDKNLLNREVYYDGNTTKITTTFQLNNVTGFNEGSYTCFASNINGITSQQISVTVVNEQGTRKAPRFLDATPDITIYRGTSIELTCGFSFHSMPTNAHWELPHPSSEILFAKHPLFTPFDSYDTYIFNRSTIVTHLHYLHSFKMSQQTLRNYTGYPEPHLTYWYHNDSLIAVTNEYMPANGWQSNDTGSYTCESCNDNGCTSYTFDVHIITGEKPIITSSSSKIHLRLGESANLTCEFTSSSTPWYTQWRIKGDKFTSEHLHYKPNTSQITSFQLKNFTENDAGIYTCVASNLDGSIYRDISVYLKHSEDQLVSTTEHHHTIIIMGGFSIVLLVLLAFAYRRMAKKQNSREICTTIPSIGMINKDNEVELRNNASYLLIREN